MLSAVSLGARPAAGDGGGERLDLQLALRTASACGSWVDDLPVLVDLRNVGAGQVVLDRTVCARSRGAGPVRVSLLATELRDVDVACTGDEQRVDSSCGAGGEGELAPLLIQELGVDEKCAHAVVRLARVGDLRQIAATPVPLSAKLTPNEVVCVRLRLTYRPGTAEGEQRAQSDQVSWRYSLTAVPHKP